MDHTGHIWITAFNEAAESIVGKTANELVEMKEVDEAQSSAVFQLALGKTYLFQCSAKQDSYNVSAYSFNFLQFLADDLFNEQQDQMRIRYSVRRASEIDYKTEAHNLIKLIDQMQV
jgi:replication factor A1